MSTFLKVSLFVTLFFGSLRLAAQQVDLEIKYNNCTSVYEVHMIVVSNITTAPGFGYLIGSSGVGIVFPGTATDVIPAITSVEGGTWSSASKINNYTFNSETTDQWKVATGGSVNAIPAALAVAGTDIILFTFPSPTGSCLPGVRLFNNWTGCTPPTQLPAGSDPCSGQPGFQGADHRSSIFLDFDGIDGYRANRNNSGTTCTTGFDFGDLTSLWGTATAAIISPDCNNDGVPDGIGGAVWAGNVVDAETTQKFSAQTNLANGDNIDGRDDEDGLTPPAIPLNLGFSYTFNVRLNSNQTGKQVFYGMWFDWNSDGNFNNDNATGTGPAFYSGSGTASSPVNLPVSVKTPSASGSGAGQANLSSYKVRLIASDVAVTSGMFNGTFTNGEVEDYQAPATILPVTFGNVTAEAKNCNIYVAFDYLSQQNNKEFDIETSTNGVAWKTVAVLGNTGNAGPNKYSFIHTSPKTGSNYYRIKQVDMDGRFSYSKTVVANSNCDGKQNIVSYPNPVFNLLTVVLPIMSNKTELRVTDAAGKILLTKVATSGINTIDMQRLTPGSYMVQILSSNTVLYSSKVIKQ
jgi:hypothetical protein